MKGLILSGGRDTRFRPLTDGGAKQLVPVASKPVLVYGIEAIAAAGIHAIGIGGDTQAEITDAVQDPIDRGLSVRPHIVDGWWKDPGKVEDMLEANRLILDTFERRIEGAVDAESRIEGKVVIEPGAVIDGSLIGANVRIHREPVKPNAYRFTLGDNSEVGIRW